LKIDPTAAAEIVERLSREGVDRVDVAAESGEKALLFTVGPVGDAPTDGVFARFPGPFRFAGRAVERDDAATGSHGVENSIDDNRLRLESSGRGIGGIELPGYLQLTDIRAIDLRQRRVARSEWIAAVRRPICVLSSQAGCEEGNEGSDSCGEKSAGH